MNNYFVILGAGKGHRFSENKPKQYFNLNGKLLIEHSIDKALDSKLFKKIIVVISKRHKRLFSKYKGKQIHWSIKDPVSEFIKTKKNIEFRNAYYELKNKILKFIKINE